MPMRRKVAGLAALIGFLACTARSAGLVRSACCSAPCDPCPIVFSKSAPANTSQKVDIAQTLAPASLHQILLPAAAAPVATVAQIPAFLSHEYRRPMRN